MPQFFEREFHVPPLFGLLRNRNGIDRNATDTVIQNTREIFHHERLCEKCLMHHASTV